MLQLSFWSVIVHYYELLDANECMSCLYVFLHGDLCALCIYFLHFAVADIDLTALLFS